MGSRNKETISYNMSRIRSKGSKIEILLGKELWANGLRYRKNYAKVYGKPDFVLGKHKITIFCDSAFWHGYKDLKTKRHEFKSNRDFWEKKIKRNIERDKEVNKKLRKDGWKVIRFWDFQILGDIEQCIEKVKKEIQK